MIRATLKNVMTGDVVDVYATIDSTDSSYGFKCWVDDDGKSYGQIQFGAPFGFELVSDSIECDQCGADISSRKISEIKTKSGYEFCSYACFEDYFNGEIADDDDFVDAKS